MTLSDHQKRHRQGRGWRQTAALVAAGIAMLAAEPASADARSVSDQIPGPSRPEDIIALPGGRWVLVSAIGVLPGDMQAGLHVIDSQTLAMSPLAVEKATGDGTACGPVLASGALKPHGVDFAPDADGGGTLHVVNHGARESIETYRLDLTGDTPLARFVTCVRVPDGVFANAVAALPGGGFVITKMYDTGDPDHAQRMGRGEVTGEVLRWTQGGSWETISGSAVSGANGILATPDGAAVIVAAWGEKRLVRVPLRGDGPVIRSPRLAYMPDNLRWTADGKVLVTGQTTNVADGWQCMVGKGPCPAPLVVQEADPLTLVPRTILERPDAGFGMASVAAPVGPDIWVGTVVGDRIWRIRRPAPGGG